MTIEKRQYIMQGFHSPGDVSLEDLPGTFWLFVLGFAVFVFGVALQFLGYPTEAGISGALAIFFVGVAIIGQLVVWGLGKID